VQLYRARALHAKVAVVDDEWATVGSSNLDPTSFALNLEANLMVQDEAFARSLRERLDELIERDCTRLTPESIATPTLWRRILRVALYHFGRRFPTWLKPFPRSPQSLVDISARDAAGKSP
jgi:cardiolipin synthase